MFDMVDTAFSYEREMIVSSFLLDFSKRKGSSLQLICNAHTEFLLWGSEIDMIGSKLYVEEMNMKFIKFMRTKL